MEIEASLEAVHDNKVQDNGCKSVNVSFDQYLQPVSSISPISRDEQHAF